MWTVQGGNWPGGERECNYTPRKKSKWDRMMRLNSFETQEVGAIGRKEAG